MKKNEIDNLLTMMKEITKKNNQSPLVTVEITKYILKQSFELIKTSPDVIENFLTETEHILESIKLNEVFEQIYRTIINHL